MTEPISSTPSSMILEIISIETVTRTTVLSSPTWLTLTTFLKSHPLFARAYYGFRIESPYQLELAIIWKSEIVEALKPFLVGSLSNYTAITVPYTTPTETTLLAKVTERATFASPKAGFEEKFTDFMAEAISPEIDCLGSTHGFALSPKDATFVALVGWTSVEAHEAVGKKESFVKAAGGITGFVNEMHMWHVDFEML